MSGDLVLLKRAGSVAEITLNRPDALNAMSRQMVAELVCMVRELSADLSLRAIILTGAGRAFCCGIDLKEISQSPEAIGEFNWHGPDSLFAVAHACPHPIISAVNGFAITGGLELALLGDFLIASDSAKFADTHARVGITPSWGLTQVLPRLIGVNRARQMSLTGGFVDAQTALDWGLVNEVLPADQLLPRAKELAGQIAETDPVTMGKIRDLIGTSVEMPLAAALTREAEIFDAHIAQVTPDAVAKRRAQVTERGRLMTADKTPDQGKE